MARKKKVNYNYQYYFYTNNKEKDCLENVAIWQTIDKKTINQLFMYIADHEKSNDIYLITEIDNIDNEFIDIWL